MPGLSCSISPGDTPSSVAIRYTVSPGLTSVTPRFTFGKRTSTVNTPPRFPSFYETREPVIAGDVPCEGGIGMALLEYQTMPSHSQSQSGIYLRFSGGIQRGE